MADRKLGAMRLQTPEEIGKTGWSPIGGAPGGSANLNIGAALLHVMVGKPQDDGSTKWLYGQPMIAENMGAVIVPITEDGNKVRLIQPYRFTAQRLSDTPKYIQEVAAGNTWDKLLDSLGRKSWQLPRGFNPASLHEQNPQQAVLKVARLEAQHEAGVELKSAEIIGYINPNDTFFAYNQAVIKAIIARTVENNPDEAEIIGDTGFFTRDDLRRMANSGELDCGFTMAALMLAGFHF